MPKPYSQLARWYDQLYNDSFYRDYATFIRNVSKKYGITRIRVLDIACGTGRLLSALLSDVAFAAGLDNSGAMLAQAKKHLPTTKFYHQDLQSMEVGEKYNVITCTFDSINYILNINDVAEIFCRINTYLEYGGIFIFDFNTIHKQAHDVTIKEKVTYQARIDGSFWIIDIETPDGKEQHRERLYSLNEISSAINNSGLHIVSIYSDFKTEVDHEDNYQRLIVIAKKEISMTRRW